MLTNDLEKVSTRSSDTAGLTDAGLKKKRLSKSSIGNNCKFAQQIKKPKVDKVISSYSLQFDEIELTCELDNLIRTACCKANECINGGCLGKIFWKSNECRSSSCSSSSCSSSSSSYFSSSSYCSSSSSSSTEDGTFNIKGALDYMKQCRKYKTGNNTAEGKEDRDSFVQDKFKIVLTDDGFHGTNRVFKYTFSIPQPDLSLLGTNNRIQCCKSTFLAVYGISSHEFRVCAELLKSSSTGTLPSLHHKAYKDDHLHDYTFAQVEDIYLANFPNTLCASKYYYLTFAWCRL